MTDAEFEDYEKATQATVKRLSAENTWLRHNLMEMENRVAAMTTQFAALETRAKALNKSTRAKAKAKAKKSRATRTPTATKSRSKK